MELTSPFKALLTLFEKSRGADPAALCREVADIELDSELRNGLQLAVQGDNRAINTWLFNQQVDGTELAWIAPIRSRFTPKYAWMVGWRSQIASAAFRCFQSSEDGSRADPVLRQKNISPPLQFVKPFAVSKTGTRVAKEATSNDEFAIFQVGYKDAPTEVSDFEQRMIINTTYLVEKRLQAIRRFKSVCTTADSTLACFEANIELFAIIHTEGHNQGHFLGAWPYEDTVKKSCLLYGAIEEFRACLASVLLVEHMPFTKEEKDAFALGVFLTRCFGYGFDAYCLPTQKRETVREITVGLLFLELLGRERMLSISDDASLELDATRLRLAMRAAFTELYDAEYRLPVQNIEGLQAIARGWYALAFPQGDYSNSAKILYNHLQRR